MTRSESPPRRSRPLAHESRPESEDFIDMERLWTVVRRQAKVVIAFVVVAIVLGLVYLRLTPPTYVSDAQVLVEQDISEAIGEERSAWSMAANDTAISTKIEVLKSADLAMRVASTLNLPEDPAFQQAPPSLVGRVVSPLRAVAAGLKGADEPEETGAAMSEADLRLAALKDAAEALRRDLAVERVGRSQVVSLSYESHDPELAHRIIQTMATAFIEDGLQAQADVSGQATEWMRERLTQLREQQQEAALAVERYRAENGLSVANGELVAEQQLSDLAGQLVLAQSEVASAEARAQQIESILAEGPDTAARSPALSRTDVEDPIVSALRERYSRVSSRLAEVTETWGADHPQAVSLAREQADIARQLYGELERLADSYRNDLAVARTREAALRDTVDVQSGSNARDSQSLVRLRELEQRADTLGELYSNLLMRYEAVLQRQSFPVSDMRVISAASVPLEPAGPRFGSTMVVSLALGLFAGLAAGAVNEFNERYFRTGGQLESDLGVRFLGYLPLMRPRLLSRLFRRRDPSRGADRRSSSGDVDASVFAETLRAIKVAIDFSHPEGRAKVIGVISAMPGEGKSTVSSNLADLLAQAGHRTLLIDGDLRKPGLSGSMAADADTGLVDAVADGRWRDRIVQSEDDGPAFLPSPAGVHDHGSEVLSSAEMGRIIEEARAVYDYVIVDLPPLGPVIDAQAFRPYADGFLLVVQWGRTPRPLVDSILEGDPDLSAKVFGGVLNQTSLSKLARYGGRGSPERAMRRYRAYYTGQR